MGSGLLAGKSWAEAIVGGGVFGMMIVNSSRSQAEGRDRFPTTRESYDR